MSLFRRTLVSALAIALVTATPVSASAESLFGAMAKAYENNPDLNAARAGLRAIDEGVAIAKSGYRPVIAGVSTLTTTDTEGYTVNSAAVGVEISQPLFDGFRTRNSVRAAEANVFAGRENLRGTEIDILLATVQAYAGVILNNQLVVYYKENLKFLQEQLSASNARFQVGEGTRTDVSLAEAELQAARASLSAATADAATSVATYVQIVGSAPSKLQALPMPKRLLPRSLEAAVDVGLREHPTILAALHGVDAAAYGVKVDEGALLPGVSVSGSVTQGDGGVTTSQLQARLSVPIYSGGLYSATVRQSKEALGQQRILVDSARRAIQQSIVSSWSQMEAARATIAANKAQVQAASLAVNGVVEQRNVGQSTTLDVLNAQQSVITGKQALAAAEYNAVVAAYAVLAGTGRLTVDRLGLQVAAYKPEVHYEATKDRWYGLRTVDGR
ncbi:outer membrane protein [Hoeflea marina]|uniref:Outer membrane protein n=1 Tax=Hoeflea marina TaxID=274592 RepID=A0A317PU29_9HYPH|nr:TolC family outer membrane protein [Hoeflea marina]PWW04215.1 outer membrane protein [Hoeflea marina]